MVPSEMRKTAAARVEKAKSTVYESARAWPISSADGASELQVADPDHGRARRGGRDEGQGHEEEAAAEEDGGEEAVLALADLVADHGDEPQEHDAGERRQVEPAHDDAQVLPGREQPHQLRVVGPRRGESSGAGAAPPCTGRRRGGRRCSRPTVPAAARPGLVEAVATAARVGSRRPLLAPPIRRSRSRSRGTSSDRTPVPLRPDHSALVAGLTLHPIGRTASGPRDLLGDTGPGQAWSDRRTDRLRFGAIDALALRQTRRIARDGGKEDLDAHRRIPRRSVLSRA